MLIRSLDDVIGTDRDVDWGNGTSRRLLVAADGRGYTVTETYVRPGTVTLLRYDNHLEACYCVEGSGAATVGGEEFPLAAGSLYAPERGEEHSLSSSEGMRLVCVFNPPLRGDENHDAHGKGPSGY